jgi:hypothetical protein
VFKTSLFITTSKQNSDEDAPALNHALFRRNGLLLSAFEKVLEGTADTGTDHGANARKYRGSDRVNGSKTRRKQFLNTD